MQLERIFHSDQIQNSKITHRISYFKVRKIIGFKYKNVKNLLQKLRKTQHVLNSINIACGFVTPEN